MSLNVEEEKANLDKYRKGVVFSLGMLCGAVLSWIVFQTLGYWISRDVFWNTEEIPAKPHAVTVKQ